MSTALDIVRSPAAQGLFQKAIPQLITDVRLRTNIADESVLLSSQDVLDLILGIKRPPSVAALKAEALIKFVKPTLVVNSPMYGRRVWAPYGEADPKTLEFVQKQLKFYVIGGLALLFLSGFTLGRLSKKGLPESTEGRTRGAFGSK